MEGSAGQDFNPHFLQEPVICMAVTDNILGKYFLFECSTSLESCVDLCKGIWLLSDGAEDWTWDPSDTPSTGMSFLPRTHNLFSWFGHHNKCNTKLITDKFSTWVGLLWAQNTDELWGYDFFISLINCLLKGVKSRQSAFAGTSNWEGAFATGFKTKDTGMLWTAVRKTVEWDQSSNKLLGPCRDFGANDNVKEIWAALIENTYVDVSNKTGLGSSQKHIVGEWEAMGISWNRVSSNWI